MLRIIKNRYLHLLLTLSLGLILGMLFGYKRGVAIVSYGYESVDNFNTFARYEGARDIASALKKKDYETAKCLADLEASSGFDYVKECMENVQCARYIADDVKKRTPEILNNSRKSFDYLYVKNGIRRCDEECLTPPSSGTR